MQLIVDLYIKNSEDILSLTVQTDAKLIVVSKRNTTRHTYIVVINLWFSY